MAIPAAMVKTTKPASGEKPIRTAPVAPVKPTCDRAAGERLSAQDEEVTNKARHDRNHGRCRESGAHKIIVKHA